MFRPARFIAVPRTRLRIIQIYDATRKNSCFAAWGDHALKNSRMTFRTRLHDDTEPQKMTPRKCCRNLADVQELARGKSNNSTRVARVAMVDAAI
jgi:hypothetical protein